MSLSINKILNDAVDQVFLDEGLLSDKYDQAVAFGKKRWNDTFNSIGNNSTESTQKKVVKKPETVKTPIKPKAPNTAKAVATVRAGPGPSRTIVATEPASEQKQNIVNTYLSDKPQDPKKIFTDPQIRRDADNYNSLGSRTGRALASTWNTTKNTAATASKWAGDKLKNPWVAGTVGGAAALGAGVGAVMLAKKLRAKKKAAAAAKAAAAKKVKA